MQSRQSSLILDKSGGSVRAEGCLENATEPLGLASRKPASHGFLPSVHCMGFYDRC
jgi:hypothetical protein